MIEYTCVVWKYTKMTDKPLPVKRGSEVLSEEVILWQK